MCRSCRSGSGVICSRNKLHNLSMFGYLCIILVGYLLGSVPSGYIGGRIGGIDIRKFGRGNIGATHVTRALGKSYGYPVFLADFSKGLAAVLVAPSLGHHFESVGSDDA